MSARGEKAVEQHGDLIVVGGGLTGLMAAWRASTVGLRTVLIATSAGSLPYTSGALDLLGVYPTETKRFRPHLWQALSELLEECPEHPYARVGLKGVRDAWVALADMLQKSPLQYGVQPEVNSLLITAAGTLKPTHLLPGSMRANAEAWAHLAPTLVLGFRRFMDFSPEHVMAGLHCRWPGLRAARVDACNLDAEGWPGRVTAANLTAAFSRPAFRAQFCEAVKPLLGGVRYLGLPAVLGQEDVMEVCGDLRQWLGVEVFEIPLLSPSIPGIRLARYLEERVRGAGVTVINGRKVSRLEWPREGGVRAVRAGSTVEQRFSGQALLLATGRFFGGGLEAHASGVREPLLNLAVETPASRDQWHMRSFLGAPGHPINRVGLQVDDTFRVLDTTGRPIHDLIYAAGAILAHHDWVREKSGAGVSVATAWGAVEAIRSKLGGEPEAEARGRDALSGSGLVSKQEHKREQP